MELPLQKVSDLFLNNKNFKQRCLSSVVMIPVVLGATAYGGWVYVAMVVAVSLWGLAEWMLMVRQAPHRPISRLIMAVIGLPYMGGFCWAMLQLQRVELFYLFVVVWVTDIGAYISGRMIGGAKLWPAVSPNKTWAGLVGGMLLAGVGGYLYAVLIPFHAWQEAAIAGLLFAVIFGGVSQMGDLFESWVKRWCRVKDSGVLIPGHGGILDRIDGLIFAAILMAALLQSIRTV